MKITSLEYIHKLLMNDLDEAKKERERLTFLLDNGDDSDELVAEYEEAMDRYCKADSALFDFEDQDWGMI